MEGVCPQPIWIIPIKFPSPTLLTWKKLEAIKRCYNKDMFLFLLPKNLSDKKKKLWLLVLAKAEYICENMRETRVKDVLMQRRNGKPLCYPKVHHHVVYCE